MSLWSLLVAGDTEGWMTVMKWVWGRQTVRDGRVDRLLAADRSLLQRRRNVTPTPSAHLGTSLSTQGCDVMAWTEGASASFVTHLATDDLPARDHIIHNKDTALVCVRERPWSTVARSEQSGTCRPASATDLRHELYWLPVRHRVVFKLANLTFNAKQFGKPSYLSDLLHEYQPARTLQSSSAHMFETFGIISKLQSKLLGTNCLWTLNLQLASAPLNLVLKLNTP